MYLALGPDANTRLWDYRAENWCRKVRAEETLIVDQIFSPQAARRSPPLCGRRAEALSGIYLSCFHPAHRL